MNPAAPQGAVSGLQPSVAVVVLATTAAQIASAMGIAIFPVMAPYLARMLDIDASYVGYQISLLFGAAMLASGMVGPVVLRWGACRAMQVALWLSAAGMIAALAGELWLMPLAALCIGTSNALAAAGAAHLLFRFGPSQHRNLIFSIKQTGVPLGWAAIALAAPTMTLSFGWQVPLLVILAYAIATALALEWWRRFWDDDRDPHANAIAILTLTSVAAAAGCVGSVFISTTWPTFALGLFYALFGVVAYGWNGVMHAQIARLSPPGMVSVATGGVMVWIFAGILIGPALFAVVYRSIGSYTAMFGYLAVGALISATLAAFAVRADRKS